MENINAFKAALSTLLAALTALWGWFGWLVIAWIACMAIDYITGSCAAIREGKWSSSVARDGIWHKMGCAVAVIVAAILDMVIGMILTNIPSVTLPFTYEVFFCPLVLVWYILTETGSIIENAGALGADIPPWLTGAIEALRSKVDEAGEAENEDKEDTSDDTAQ